MLSHTVTVLVTGEDGQTLKVGLAGWRGLAPLSEVHVVGRVAAKSEGAMVIHAHAIHVTPAETGKEGSDE